MDASHEVLYAPEAEDDLAWLYGFIRARSGDPKVAAGYVRRVRAHCEKLSTFPERGTRRDDLAEGLRTIGFERRATVVFAVHAETVQVLRIYYGGRSIGPSTG